MNIYKPAGFWIRLGASLLDYMIVSVPLLLIYWLITGKDPNDSMFISLIVLLYSILLPVFWNGYLIGKRICGIRIVKKDGSQVSLLTMFLRVIVAGLVYGITFGLGLIASLILIGVREDKRTLHDLISGTYVTYAAPGEEELYTGRTDRKERIMVRSFYCEKENPRLGLGFQKAFSVVLRKLPRVLKYFWFANQNINIRRSFLCQKTLTV